MKTATFVRQLDDFNGVAGLYYLSEPVTYTVYEEDEDDYVEVEKHTEFVIVSAITAIDTGMPETYIFPASADGEIIDWSELRGSIRGVLSHHTALERAGYQIIEER